MSAWRREASHHLPELQKLIASPQVDSPMMLWIELRIQFEKFCVDLPGNRDLLRRFWAYCGWCLDSKNQDVSTAAALVFCEHLIDTPAMCEALPHLMNRADFLGLKELLLYHNSEEQFAAALAMFGR